MEIVKLIKSNRVLKRIALWLLQDPYRPRPRFWVKVFWNPIVHHKGSRSLVSKRSRMDVFPFNHFSLGDYSTIEDYSCVNNAMGAVSIGSKSRVGIGNTVIGPVSIGNNVNMAQNIVVSGLNHGYQDVTLPPREQKCSVAEITIADDCWIGANVVITAGVSIGKHCVIAGGSVVTKSIPAYSVAVGNPARVVKYYDFEKEQWCSVKNQANKKDYGKAA